MVNKKPTKAEMYTMVIDRDRDAMLTMLMNFASHCDEWEHWLQHLREENMVDLYKAFVKEKGDKSHKLDWCKDPNCDN